MDKVQARNLSLVVAGLTLVVTVIALVVDLGGNSEMSAGDHATQVKTEGNNSPVTLGDGNVITQGDSNVINYGRTEVEIARSRLALARTTCVNQTADLAKYDPRMFATVMIPYPTTYIDAKDYELIRGPGSFATVTSFFTREVYAAQTALMIRAGANPLGALSQETITRSREVLASKEPLWVTNSPNPERARAQWEKEKAEAAAQLRLLEQSYDLLNDPSLLIQQAIESVMPEERDAETVGASNGSPVNGETTVARLKRQLIDAHTKFCDFFVLHETE